MTEYKHSCVNKREFAGTGVEKWQIRNTQGWHPWTAAVYLGHMQQTLPSTIPLSDCYQQWSSVVGALIVTDTYHYSCENHNGHSMAVAMVSPLTYHESCQVGLCYSRPHAVSQCTMEQEL